MLEKGEIDIFQFYNLVITLTIGTSIPVTPAALAKLAKRDSWLASVLTVVVSLLFIFLYNQISSLYPNQTYVEMNEKIFR
ncbi:GerAB/ArcD/ProY family transporter [Niallia endozanthoxylica]|uniref:GerAB/ArcD/ProY family transporter n=1 Tax=Niallia endozanthoxylica TaxID=2036016 RepID=A0A5J5H311_9BACI|nr:GerAB/ArcD/ProY family transporter [Niallia endozanthoxylica]